MILLINKRESGRLFHYAHFICDCLYIEIINDLYKYDKVIRLKTIDQTLGNFVNIYEEVMNIKSIELSKIEFDNLIEKQIILYPKEKYTDIQSMNKFRHFIFNRYNVNPLLFSENYPQVILIKRGNRIQLINDFELQNINNNITTGSERREIHNLEKVEEYLKNKYSDKFRCILLEYITFEEQVKLFNNAKLIILAHGAAMSNMFFCKKHTIIIEITCNCKWKFFDIISKNLELNHIKLEINESKYIINYLDSFT
jgi:hypothetical protein